MKRLQKYRPYLPLLAPLGIGIAIASAILMFEVMRPDMEPGSGPALVATSTPTPTTSPAATSTPTSTAGATSTPAPTATSTPEAEPLYPPLTVGEPVELPEGVTLFVWDGCTGCDGPNFALRRVTRVGDEIRSEVVSEPSGDAYFLNGWVEGGLVYAFQCSTGSCSGVGESTSDAAVTLYRSWSEGDQWESLGELPVSTDPYRFPEPSDWNIEGPSAISTEDLSDGVLELGGVSLDLRRIDDRGVTRENLPPYYANSPSRSAEGRYFLRWGVRLPEATVPYVSVFDSNGTEAGTYSGSWPAFWISEDQLIGTVVYDSLGLYSLEGSAQGWLPSIIDLQAGTVRPILDPFEETPGNRNFVMGVIVE